MDKHRNSSPYRIVTPSIVVFVLFLVAVGGIFVLDAKADGGGAVPTDTPEPTSTMTPEPLDLVSEPATEVPTLVIMPEATLDSTEEAFMAQLDEAVPLPASPTPAEAASGGMSATTRCLIGFIVIAVVAVIFLVYVRMKKARGE